MKLQLYPLYLGPEEEHIGLFHFILVPSQSFSPSWTVLIGVWVVTPSTPSQGVRTLFLRCSADSMSIWQWLCAEVMFWGSVIIAQVGYFCGVWISVILWILDLFLSLQGESQRIGVLLYLVDEIIGDAFCRSLENHMHTRFLLNLTALEGPLRDLMWLSVVDPCSTHCSGWKFKACVVQKQIWRKKKSFSIINQFLLWSEEQKNLLFSHYQTSGWNETSLYARIKL